MASLVHILPCLVAALALYAFLGLPLATRIAPRPLAIMMAPGLGWAAHSVLALPLMFALGMSRLAVVLVFVVPLCVAMAASWRDWRDVGPQTSPAFGTRLVYGLALAGAAILATVLMAAVLPKYSSSGVTLAGPIFDHSKIAMIDDMARLGVPPGNPFFGAEGSPPRLSYYYLWHFSAAELSVLFNISGWEADAVLAWVTDFASLTLMIGLAVWLSGRVSAALWAVALAATGSVRPLLYAIFGVDRAEAIVGYQSGFGGWLFQTTWAPQHTASAMCAVIAAYLLVQAAERTRVLTVLLFALVMAAGFESSTWVGGIVFPLAAGPVALLWLARAAPPRRLAIVASLGAAAIIALLLIAPFLYDQVRMSMLRGDGSPVAIQPFVVLGDDVMDWIGDRFGSGIAFIANAAAYWFILLPVEFPAFLLTGLAGFYGLSRERGGAPDRKVVVIGFGISLAASLGAAWLLLSTLGENNDLGWRAVLPGVLLLIVFGAAGLSRLDAARRPYLLGIAVVLLLLGMPDGVRFGYGNFVVKPNAASKGFAATPALWRAVRRHTGPDERIANNPAFMEIATPWPVNISWALLANRRSCYAGLSLIGPFSAQSHAHQEVIDAQFARVFEGKSQLGDIVDLAMRYHCAVAVVTPSDGAWTSDPFATSPLYRLVENTADWRIYRVVPVKP
ncbi:MAG: hypothetical protein GC182_00425 [Rhodopseudomonas sp.]|nr:hypothetical protein [Rhodopseudomonas sp.]